jgi:hypothetical protein
MTKPGVVLPVERGYSISTGDSVELPRSIRSRVASSLLVLLGFGSYISQRTVHFSPAISTVSVWSVASSFAVYEASASPPMKWALERNANADGRTAGAAGPLAGGAEAGRLRPREDRGGGDALLSRG